MVFKSGTGIAKTVLSQCTQVDSSIYNIKEVSCEECAFIPEDRVQLDLVYKDGNKKNKKKNNLLTLCANCARLYNKKLRTLVRSQ
jgi:hypothetical protein